MFVTHNKEKEQDHHQLPQLKTKPQELPGLQLTENIRWEKHVGSTTAKANKVSDFAYMNPKGRQTTVAQTHKASVRVCICGMEPLSAKSGVHMIGDGTVRISLPHL